MKIKQKKNPKAKWIYLLSGTAVAIVVGVVIYFMLSGKLPFSNTNPTQAPDTTDSLPSLNDPAKPDVKNQDAGNGSQTNEEIPVSQSGSVSITSFSQKNGFVNVQAKTANFDTKKCVYSFVTDGGKPVVKEQSGPCSSLSIDQNEFDKIGAYTLTVTAYSGTQKISVKKEVDVL